MADKENEAVLRLFSQLQLAGEDGNYEDGLELVNKILRITPDDEDAIACRLVCLVQLSEFQEALKLIEWMNKKSDGLVHGHLFEKAYCLYRTEKYEQSLLTLDKLPKKEQDATRIHDLRAQIYYRLEKYSASTETFNKSLEQEKSNERETNFSAALAYCDPSTVESILQSVQIGQETMEQCFNLATAYLYAQQDHETLQKVEDLLRKAEKLGIVALEEDGEYMEEEIEQELVPVRVQLAYTLQLQGKNEEAMALYSSVLKLKPTNPVHTITAANNIIVLNQDKDIFDSKKKVKLLTNELSLKKLKSKQQLVVLYNRCLFALQTNQLEQCRQLLVQLKKKFPEHELTVLAESSLLLREKKVAESVTALEQYVLSHPTASILLHLSLAQVHVVHGNHAKVREVIQKIPNFSQHLGVVSALVSQQSSVGDVDGAMKTLNSACQWWINNVGVQAVNHKLKGDILWGSAQFMMQLGQPESAAKLFETLVREDSANVQYLSALIAACAKFDPRKAEELVQSLPQSPVVMSVDVDSLEQMPSFKHTRRQVAKAEAGVSEKTVATSEKKKKKKKRKPRFPKQYDPTKQPDPERWLPLRERSYYRRGKRKGQSFVGRGTQGASAATAGLTAQLDASKPKPPIAESKSSDTASPRAKSQPSQKKQQPRKKKKGRR